MDSISGLLAIGVFLWPGILFASSFEAIVGPWRIGLSDRILRFVSFSVLFHILTAPATYFLWVKFGLDSPLLSGRPLPWVLWPVGGAYVAFPFILGAAVGKATLERKEWAAIFTGRAPAPRAWDYLFSSSPGGWLRLKLKSGIWIGGAFAREGGRRSYAAGYPEQGDVFIAEAFNVDPSSGAIILDDEGQPQALESSLLVRWDEVEYLEFEEIE